MLWLVVLLLCLKMMLIVFYECVKDNFEVIEYNDKRKKNYDDRIDFGYNSLHLLIKFLSLIHILLLVRLMIALKRMRES